MYEPTRLTTVASSAVVLWLHALERVFKNQTNPLVKIYQHVSVVVSTDIAKLCTNIQYRFRCRFSSWSLPLWPLVSFRIRFSSWVWSSSEVSLFPFTSFLMSEVLMSEVSLFPFTSFLMYEGVPELNLKGGLVKTSFVIYMQAWMHFERFLFKKCWSFGLSL